MLAGSNENNVACAITQKIWMGRSVDTFAEKEVKLSKVFVILLLVNPTYLNKYQLKLYFAAQKKDTQKRRGVFSYA